MIAQRDGCDGALNHVLKIYIAKAPSSGAQQKSCLLQRPGNYSLGQKRADVKTLRTGGNRQACEIFSSVNAFSVHATCSIRCNM